MLVKAYFGINVSFSTFKHEGVAGERCILDPSAGDMIEDRALSLPFSFETSSEAVVGEGAKRHVQSYGNMAGEFSVTVVRDYETPMEAMANMFEVAHFAKDVRGLVIEFFSPYFPNSYKYKGVLTQIAPVIPLDAIGGKRLYTTYNFSLSEL